jgi:long-chain acyl-CoA synthetase
MISQYNVVYTVESLRECIDFDSFVGKRAVSYLPMAHIAERMMSHYQAMILGYSVYCCPDPNQLTMYLGEVHPQIMFGVPRVYEKVYAGVNAALAADPDRKQKFDEAIAAALEIKAAERAGTATQEQLETWAFLDAVAFSKVRALVGIDAVEVAVTGAAPDPGQDPRVVQRHRRAAVGDLRHERVQRPDDVVAQGQQARLRRPGRPRLRDRRSPTTAK